MKRYIVGNWKSHKDLTEAKAWIDQFASGYRPSAGLDVIFAPTFICLENVAAYLAEKKLENVYLAAQDVSPFPKGGYTGAVAADLIKDFVDYVIVGHSERRRYFHETSQDVANKVGEAIEADLIPIVCVDQPYAMSQLMALADMEIEKMLLAYSPVEALNFRIPESPGKVEESVTFIHNIHPDKTVIYGGSLTPDNVDSYLGLKCLSGLFVGSASLDPASFVKICNKAGTILPV